MSNKNIFLLFIFLSSSALAIGDLWNTIASYLPSFRQSSATKGITSQSTQSTQKGFTDTQCIRMEIANIRIVGLQQFIAKRKAYLKETERNGLAERVKGKLLDVVRSDLKLAEQDIKTMQNLLKKPDIFADKTNT